MEIECPLAFKVEVIDENGTMRLTLDDCPQPGIELHVVAPFQSMLMLSRVIQLKAMAGFTAGRA